MSGRNIYVGRISDKTRERDLQELFEKYGKVTHVSLKVGFGFVEFDDPRDADDAVRKLDGYDLDGSRLLVEHSRGGSSRDRRGGGDEYRGRGDRYDRDRRDDDRGRGGDRGRRGPPIRTSHRVLVDNLSSTCNWRDLKDICRDVAKASPTYADVYRDGTGVVEFESHEDMKRAIKELDDYKFQGRRIYMKEDKGKDRYEPYSRSSKRGTKSPRKGSKSPSPKRASKSPERKGSKLPEKRGRSPSPKRGSPKRGSHSRSPSPAEQNGDRKGSRSPSP